MEYLMLYRWPGNVRQLANEMRRLAALAETSAVLMPEHLSPEITASRRTVPASERTLDPTEVVVRLDQPMAAAVRHLEQTMVQYALKKCEGRIEDTADDARPVAQGPLPEAAAVRHRAARKHGRRRLTAPAAFFAPSIFGGSCPFLEGHRGAPLPPWPMLESRAAAGVGRSRATAGRPTYRCASATSA